MTFTNIYSFGSKESFSFLLNEKGELLFERLSGIEVEKEWRLSSVNYFHLKNFPKNYQLLKLSDLLSIDEKYDRLICEALAVHFSLFFEGTDYLPEPFLNLPKAIFYPGSFNPWHQGHSACLRLSKKPILVIPDESPWKDSQQKRILERLFELKSISSSNISLYPGFLGLQKNPTYMWIRRVKGPKKLLMGADSFLSIHKWMNASELLDSLDELHVASRGESEEDVFKQLKLLKTINTKLQVTFLGTHEFEEVSSSSIRRAKLDGLDPK